MEMTALTLPPDVLRDDVAEYLLKVRPLFLILKQMIHSVGGCLILVEAKGYLPDSVVPSLRQTYENFVQTYDDLLHAHPIVPVRASNHYQHLIQAAECLKGIMVAGHAVDWSWWALTHQMKRTMELLTCAYDHLKQTSSFRLDLPMISLDTACVSPVL